MAVVTVSGNPVVGTKYTVTTANSADWASVSNSTYFYDLTDKLVYYKDSSGTILSVFSSAGGLTYFTEARSTTAPNNVTNVDSLSAGTGLSTTDVDIAIVPRANGAFLLDIPDSSISGGNKRGTNAIDLQIVRASATQVASGNYSVAIGYGNTASNSHATAIGRENIASAIGSTSLGYTNTSSGSYSFSVGLSNVSSGNYSFTAGQTNTASGTHCLAVGQNNTTGGFLNGLIGYGNTINNGGYSMCFGYNNTSNNSTSSFCIGQSNISSGVNYAGAMGISNTSSGGNGSMAIGYSNTASGTNGSMAIGTINTASGDSSVAIGSRNTANSANSLSLGNWGSSNSIINKISFGNRSWGDGSFYQNSAGVLQSGKIMYSAKTTDATTTTLTTDQTTASATNQLTLINNQAIRFKGTIIGKQNSNSVNVGVWDIDGVIVRGNGVGTTTLVIGNVNVVTNTSSWGTPTLSANTTTGCLTVNVIGLGATTIGWFANLELTEVAYT